MRDEGVIYVAGHQLLNRRCTRLPGCIRLRNDLYCVGWGVKLYSLTCVILTSGHFDGDAWQRHSCCWKVNGTRYSVSERIMNGTANHFPAKNALDCRILHIYSLNIFWGGEGVIPGRHRSAPSAWTQTPISAWLASVVPIVPVLRNDHWS